jgi:signal transduction histidine kinase
MAFTPLQTAIKTFYNHGVRPSHTGADIAQIRTFNSIWLATYGTLLFSNLVAFFGYHYKETVYIVFIASFHLLFLIARYLTGRQYFTASRHLFMITTYCMLIFHDHYLGKEAFTQVYFIAFLPTALSIFSVKTERVTILFYSLSPIFIMLVSQAVTQNLFPANKQAAILVTAARYYNITMGFMMALLYMLYNVYLRGVRQARLLNQRIGLQATLDNGVGAIWSIDESYNLIAFNKQFENFSKIAYGVTNIKAGYNIRNIVEVSELTETWPAFYKRVFAGESFTEDFFYSGHAFEFKATPIFNEDEKIIGATFNSRNITKRVEAEKKLIEAKQKAEAASESKAKFLSNMSHEIRTPLNGIVGLSSIMLDQPHLPDQKPNLESLHHLSEHTLQLINSILDFSKLEAGKATLEKTPFNLKVLLAQVESMFSLQAKLKGLDFSINTNRDIDLFLLGDATRLSQVLINLLSNAIKFTEKGSVQLKLHISDWQDVNNYEIQFSVIDTGIGIKRGHLSKIFESFTQADLETTRRFGGTGLGVTISDKILELMQSKLMVQSELNKGSTFYFTVVFNKATEADMPVKNIEPVADNDALQHIKILVAEDNVINQKVAKQIIQKWGASVAVVENGAMAVDYVNNQAVDMILMDLDMPVMDGYEATTIIKQKHPSIPVIALTAAAFDDMENFLAKKGFDDVVQKPFIPATLRNKLTYYAGIKNIG